MISNKPKTIFCDIDGTLIRHIGPPNLQLSYSYTKKDILKNSIKALNLWESLGYNIILTTGRRESARNRTVKSLEDLGIIYDKLIMGLGGGDRILINDRKPNSVRNTSYCINLPRNEGLEHFDFHSKYVTIKDNQPRKVKKPWGHEELIEYNDKYVVKKLFMKKNECCSLQYHKIKKETIYVLSGKLKLYIGRSKDDLDTMILSPGDNITINPYIVHRMEGIEDSYYLETSTNEIYDVVRLDDKYNRNKIDKSYK